MKALLKYLGALILLIGVAILAISFMQGVKSNLVLVTGLVLVIGGYLGHIVINKRLQD